MASRSPYLPLLFFSFLCFAIILIACRSSEPQPEPEELTIEWLILLPDEELMERDSDGDGLSDYDEIYIYGTDPLNPDTDGDGLTDYEEIFVYGTDPLNPDSDGDGFTDGQEVEMGTNPLDPNDPPFIREEDLQKIYFSFGSKGLSDEAKDLLLENADMLMIAEKFTLKLHGFADDTEISDEASSTIQDQRVKAILEFYNEQGVTEDRIDIETEVLSSDDCITEPDENNSCAENRRVDTIPVNPYPFYPQF